MVPAVIVTEAVSRYLAELRSESDPVLAEMEAHGARDGIPIVVPETSTFIPGWNMSTLSSAPTLSSPSASGATRNSRSSEGASTPALAK